VPPGQGMGTQITEGEFRTCSCSWNSRTWFWYQMSHKPGKGAARRVRGPYLNYSTSTTPLLAAKHTDQQCAKQKAPPERWGRGDGGATGMNEQRE